MYTTTPTENDAFWVPSQQSITAYDHSMVGESAANLLVGGTTLANPKERSALGANNRVHVNSTSPVGYTTSYGMMHAHGKDSQVYPPYDYPTRPVPSESYYRNPASRLGTDCLVQLHSPSSLIRSITVPMFASEHNHNDARIAQFTLPDTLSSTSTKPSAYNTGHMGSAGKTERVLPLLESKRAQDPSTREPGSKDSRAAWPRVEDVHRFVNRARESSTRRSSSGPAFTPLSLLVGKEGCQSGIE